MTGTPYSVEDPSIGLLGLLIDAKRTEQAARHAAGEATKGPATGLVLPLWRTWRAADDAQRAVRREIRRRYGCNVIQMVQRSPR